MQSIPLVDLSLQHERVAEDVRRGFDRVLADTSFVLGREVAEFEEAFARYCGAHHVIGVANGTDAIELALRAIEVRPGDEVIIPANTFIATAEAVIRAGAEVVLADCDDNYLLDVTSVERYLSVRTRAVVPVHLYGQTVPVERLRAILPDHVAIVEDAAQAQGARRYGVRAGTLGTVAATSFYPGKNLGAYGDAGAVITNSDSIARRVRLLRNHGGVAKYEHEELGMNSRLDSLQAVVLSAKLSKLDAWNQERRVAAKRYDDMLAGVEGVVTPRALWGNEHVYHLYVILVTDRDDRVAQLQSAGIGVGVHYPKPLHRLSAFQRFPFYGRSFPRSDNFASSLMSLPIYPGITPAQQERVVDTLVLSMRQHLTRPI